MPTKKRVLLPVKRTGWRQYQRRWVTDPQKIKQGEKLSKQWGQEIEAGLHNPILYPQIAWKSKDKIVRAETRIQLRGNYTRAKAKKKAREELFKRTGTLPTKPTGPSPGLYLVNVQFTRTTADKRHYDLNTAGHFLGQNRKDLNGW